MQLIIIAILVALIVLLFSLRRMYSAYRVNSSLEALEEFVGFNEERVGKIKPYIIDYFNTLHAGGDRTIEVLNFVLASLRERIEEAKKLLKAGGVARMNEANRLLTRDLVLGDNKIVLVEDYDEKEMITLPPDLWEVAVDDLFQAIGEKLAEASEIVAAYRSTPRRRKGTITALIEAGIQGISDKPQQKKVTGSFKAQLAEEGKSK